MKRSQSVLLVGILIVALSLRPAVASISPILEIIRSSLGLSYSTVSLLTTIPTLCMGVFALTIPSVTKRIGRERGVFWGVVLITGATAIRFGSWNAFVIFTSTILVGIGIAVTQALLPSLVTQYFPDRESFATGLYTASLTIGAALAGAITAPLVNFFDSWPAALAIWALPAGLAIPLWWLSWQWASNQRGETETNKTRAQFPWRDQWAWVLTLFFGGSSTVFFFVLTWLAPRYVGLGWTADRAGFLLSVFIITQLGGNLGISAVGDRFEDQRPLFVTMLVLIIAGATGIAFLPRVFPWIWAVLLGIGAGGLFTLGLTLPVTYAAGPTATDGLTSMMLGGGYLIAAFGPFVAGAIRDLTGSYGLTFVGLVLLTTIMLGVSLFFDPRRTTVSATRGGDEEFATG